MTTNARSRTRAPRWSAMASKVLCLAAAFLVFAAACDAGTGGALVSVSLEAASDANATPVGSFMTDTGWSVVLTEARLVVGPIYAFAPDPDAVTPFTRRNDRSSVRHAATRLARLLGPAIARAHGGVDPLSGRVVRAEWLVPFALDLLATSAVALGPTSASSGEVDAIEIRLVPPPTAIASQSSGHQAYFAGTATKNAVSIDFAGGIDIADTGTEARVEGIALDAVLSAGGVLSLVVRTPTFFRGVSFDELPPEDPVTGVRPLAVGSQPYEAIELGLRNPRAYSASYSAAGGAP